MGDRYRAKARAAQKAARAELWELRERQRTSYPEYRSCRNSMGMLKAAFETQEEALESHGAQAGGLRAYSCPKCGLWHLTKKNPRED